jgi:hypothetical protein
MKSKFTYLGLLAILFSACTTGSYVTSSYTDDIYFNPGDVPPPIVVETKTVTKPVQQKSDSKIIISEISETEEGANVMNNYIFEEQKVMKLHFSTMLNKASKVVTLLFIITMMKYNT